MESRSRWDGLSGLDSALSKSAAGTGAAHCGADGSIAFCRAQSAREGAEFLTFPPVSLTMFARRVGPILSLRHFDRRRCVERFARRKSEKCRTDIRPYPIVVARRPSPY